MFERFTERARRVISLSQEEARRLNRTVAPEHVLLGIVSEADGVGGIVLGKLGVTLESARGTVESVAGRTEGPPRGREVRFSDDGKKALEYALAEARRLKHNYIGTEHLLLGLFLLESGPIAEILKHLRLSRERVLDDILQTLASRPPGVRAVLANDLTALRRPSTTLPELLAQPPPGARSAEPRNNVVMCRVNDRDLDAIDALVEAGARATRSDAAAWLIHAGIESNKALFDKLHATVAEIRRLREQAQEITRKLALEDAGPADPPPSAGSPPPEGESPAGETRPGA